MLTGGIQPLICGCMLQRELVKRLTVCCLGVTTICITFNLFHFAKIVLGEKPNTVITIIIIIIKIRPHLQLYLIICLKLYIYNEQIQATRLLTDRREPKILIFIICTPCCTKKKKKYKYASTSVYRHRCSWANRSAASNTRIFSFF